MTSGTNLCPKCNRDYGQVTNSSGDIIVLKCSCGHIWQMHSGTCPKCNEANGYPFNGTCLKCYEARKKAG